MATKLEKIREGIERQIEGISSENITGKEIGSFDKSLLIIGDDDITDHLRMQPAAVAYYGMLLKRAESRLRRVKTKYDEWHHKMYAKCADELAEESRYKPTANDIEAKITTYKKNYRKYRDAIAEAESTKDMIEVWYNAIQQKGFSMNQISDIISDELMSKDDVRSKMKKVTKGKR